LLTHVWFSVNRKLTNRIQAYIDSRHERDQSFLVQVPVPANKEILVSVPAEKVFGPGPGPGGKKF
jgi:hypothetical protein